MSELSELLSDFEEEVFASMRKFYMAISKADDVGGLKSAMSVMDDMQFMVNGMIDKIETKDDMETFKEKILEPFGLLEEAVNKINEV